MLIPNLPLDFWNSNARILLKQIWAKKSQNCPFCLKIGTHCVLEELMPNPKLDFWNSNPIIYFDGSLDQKAFRLFSFDTLMLFLGIELILVLCFKIATDSAAF